MHFFYKKHEQRKAITSKPQPKSQPRGWKVCRECHSEAHALKDNLSEVQRDEGERDEPWQGPLSGISGSDGGVHAFSSIARRSSASVMTTRQRETKETISYILQKEVEKEAHLLWPFLW